MAAANPLEALEEMETSLLRETVRFAASQLICVPAPPLERVAVSWPTQVYRRIRQWRRARG